MLEVQENFATGGSTYWEGLKNSVVARVTVNSRLKKRIVWIALGPYDLSGGPPKIYWHLSAEVRFLLNKNVVGTLPLYVGNFVNYPPDAAAPLNDAKHPYQFTGGDAPSMLFHTDKNSTAVVQEHEAVPFPIEIEADTVEVKLLDCQTDNFFIGIIGVRVQSSDL